MGQDSRLPKLIFMLLVLYAAVHFSYYYPQLPGTVAGHFNAHGVANGWQSKQAFFTGFVTVSVLAAFMTYALPLIIGVIPPQLVNLPNKRYWLAPERLAETTGYLKTYFGWFGCAMYLIIIFTFDYAVQSNLHPENPPSAARMWYVLAATLVFTVIWIGLMFARFLRAPVDTAAPK